MTVLRTWDYLVIIIYLIIVQIIGFRFAKTQRTTQEYFLAGKSLGWLPLGISMFATYFDSIVFAGVPAESFKYDLQFALLHLLIPVATVVAVILFVDLFYRLNIVSMFEYMELRFGPGVRSLAALVYIVFRCTSSAMVMFVVSLSIHVATGFPLAALIIIVGLSTIVYTAEGGLRGVVWTDVMQFFVLFGGILYLFVSVLRGFDDGWTKAASLAWGAGKFRMVNLEFSFTTRLTLWGFLPYALLTELYARGTDQFQMQRAFAAKSLNHAKWAAYLGSILAVPVIGILYLLGIGFYASNLMKPNAEVSALLHGGQHDRILPYYIMHAMPVGIRGMMVAGLLAAAMSTLSSALNSLSTICTIDLYKRWVRGSASEDHYAKFSRWMAATLGVVVAMIALAMINLRSILYTSGTLVSYVTGPLLGVFLLGILFRKSHGKGVAFGVILSVIATLFVGEGLKILWGYRVAFSWVTLFGIFTTMAFGYAASLLLASGERQGIEKLLWKWQGLRQMLGLPVPQEARDLEARTVGVRNGS